MGATSLPGVQVSLQRWQHDAQLSQRDRATRYISTVDLLSAAGQLYEKMRLKRFRIWWRWALVGPDGVASSRMVDVSASVHLPLHHKVQKFSSGTGSPGWSWIKGHKKVVVVVKRLKTDE